MNLPVAPPEPAGAETQTPGWHARLQLRFAVREGRTYLAHREHRGPLLVQRTFHPEGDACHAYIVHPPGGVVGGDRLELEVTAEPHSHAVLTTPAATKFYRGLTTAQQTQDLFVNDAAMEWLPQETIFYRAAQVHSTTRVQLTGGSRFIGWEIPCLGLPARGESFDRGELRLATELWRDGAPLFVDRLKISGTGDAQAAPWGLAGHRAFGILLATPAGRDSVTALRSIEAADCEFAVTLVDGVLVCRCLAAQAEPIRRMFTNSWRILRPVLMGREAVLPRIWMT